MKHTISKKILSILFFCSFSCFLYSQGSTYGDYPFDQDGITIISGKITDPTNYRYAQWSEGSFSGDCTPGGATFFEVTAYDHTKTSNNYIHLVFRTKSFVKFNGLDGPPKTTFSVYNDISLEADYLWGYQYWTNWHYDINFVLGYNKNRIYSSYTANYIDNTHSISSPQFDITKVKVEEGLDGNFYIIAYKSSTIVATIGLPKNANEIYLGLKTNLVLSDNTKDATPQFTLSGSCKSIYNKAYDAALVFNSNTIVGNYTYSDIDWTNSYLKQGSTNIGITAVNSCKIIKNSIGEYEMTASLVGSDSKTYDIMGIYVPECRMVDNSHGSLADFSFENASHQISCTYYNIPKEMDTANDNDEWESKGGLFVVSGYDSSKSSDNYAQVGFTLGADSVGKTRLYTNGKGPKPGWYEMKIPHIWIKGFDNAFNTWFWWYVTNNFVYNGPVAVGNNYHGFTDGGPVPYWRSTHSSYVGKKTAGNLQVLPTTSFNDAHVIVREGKGGNIFVAVIDPSGNILVSIGELPGYNLTINIDGNGHVDRESVGCGNSTGDKITLTPVADAGWSFQGFTAGCTSQVTDNHDGTYTFTIGSSDCTLTAKFVPGIETTDYRRECSFPFPWNSYTINGAEDNGKKYKTRNWNNTQDSTVTLNLTVLTPLPEVNYSKKICKGDSWTDNHFSNLTTAGSYSKTYKYNGTECDSITYNLTLSILPDPQVISYEGNICEGGTFADEYFAAVNTPGLHTKKIRFKGQSCDSVVYELNLHVWTPTQSEKTTTICASTPLPFEWDNISFPRAVATDTVIVLPGANAHGCDSTVIRHLRITDISTTDTFAYYCNGTSFEWYGKQYTIADAPIHLTFTSAANCDSVVNLHLKEMPATIINAYDKYICKDTPYSDEHFTNITTEGLHEHSELFRGTDCDSVIHRLNLHFLPNPKVVAYEENICQGAEYSDEHFSHLTTSGLHTLNIPFTGYACDSVIYQLTLNIHQPTQSESSRTVCYNAAFPLVWDNISFPRPVDTDTTIVLPGGNAHGCDSTVIRHLKVREFAEGDTAAYYCHGTSFEWYGTLYTIADAPIQRTFLSAANCDSIVTLHLKEMDETIMNIYEKSICEGETYSDEFFPEEMSSTGVYEQNIMFLGTDCDSVYHRLTLTVNAPSTSEETKTIEKEELPYTWDGIVFTTFADTTIVLPNGNANGCDSTIIRHLIRKPCLELKANLTVDTICANQKKMRVRLAVEQGEVTLCSVTYPEQEPNRHFRDTLNLPLTSDRQQTLVIPFIANSDTMRYIRPDSYPVVIAITDDCERVTKYDLTLHVLYPSWLLQQRWNDMIMLYNEKYNGGYSFSNIRWYYNGSDLIDHTQGENHSYIYVRPQLAMGANDFYWAELTRSDDGKTICTCKMQAIPMSDDIIFNDDQPQPQQVITLSSTTIDATHRDIAVSGEISGTYRLYSANGMTIQNGYFGPKYQQSVISIESTLPSGAYILLLQGDEGTSTAEKLLIIR